MENRKNYMRVWEEGGVAVKGVVVSIRALSFSGPISVMYWHSLIFTYFKLYFVVKRSDAPMYVTPDQKLGWYCLHTLVTGSIPNFDFSYVFNLVQVERGRGAGCRVGWRTFGGRWHG